MALQDSARRKLVRRWVASAARAAQARAESSTAVMSMCRSERSPSKTSVGDFGFGKAVN